MLPTSSDEWMGGAGDSDDSGDSNFNGYHPGFGGGGGGRPRMTRFGRDDEPRLGCGSGPAFWAREARQAAVGARERRQDVVVGDVTCPFQEPRPITFGREIVNAKPTMRGMHVAVTMVHEVDLSVSPRCSPSSVKLPEDDPMLVEALLCTPRKVVSARSRAEAAHSVDLCPHDVRWSRSRQRGFVGSVLDSQFELLSNRSILAAAGPADGSDFSFGARDPNLVVGSTTVGLDQPMELSLGPRGREVGLGGLDLTVCCTTPHPAQLSDDE